MDELMGSWVDESISRWVDGWINEQTGELSPSYPSFSNISSTILKHSSYTHCTLLALLQPLL